MGKNLIMSVRHILPQAYISCLLKTTLIQPCCVATSSKCAFVRTSHFYTIIITHSCMHTQTHARMHTHMHTNIHTHMHTHMHMHTHTHTHAHTHTHTHTHTTLSHVQYICNLEREYRDCAKSKIGITRHNMMHQVLYI